MIDSLRGWLVSLDEQSVVLEVSGVAYRIFCPDPGAFPIHRERDETLIYTHLVLKEEEAVLYGFPTAASRSLFRQLVSVSGIGPKAALSILTTGSPTEVISAIREEQVAFFTRAPGVGKKTAQRLILELRDHLPESAAGFGRLASVDQQDGQVLLADGQGIWADVVAALTSLGFAEGEAQTMVGKVRRQDLGEMSVDEALKLVLQTVDVQSSPGEE